MNRQQFNTLKRIVQNKLTEYYKNRTVYAEKLANQEFEKLTNVHSELIKKTIAAKIEARKLENELKKKGIEISGYYDNTFKAQRQYNWRSKAKAKYEEQLSKLRDEVQGKLLKLELSGFDADALAVYNEIMDMLKLD